MRRAAPCTLVALALALAAPGAARADVFEATSLASVDQVEQANVAEHPAISGNGRYVAFDGSFGGVSGVWRRDLETKAVEAVAVGVARTPAGDAKLPSISQDGRYVSFTTTARLDEKNDTNKGPDVYVRDMNDPNSKPCPPERNELSEPCPFTLASAVDGSAKGLSYKYGSVGEETTVGALASGRSALTADGRHVAFITTASSDLSGPETSPLQVAVRDLDTNTTRLVSALYDPSTSGPKIDPKTGQDMPVPTTQEGGIVGAVFDKGSIPTFQFPDPSVGAAISADGSTVTWLGQKIESQAPMLAEDQARRPNHAEPLWRRIADGRYAPTRRVSGGSDPVNQACSASGETRLKEPPTLEDPCQGPFAPGGNGTGIEPASGGDYLPRLSADGRVVAFLASAPLVPGAEFGGTSNFSDDLYWVDMADGFTRVQSLQRLTAIAAGGARDFGRVEPIEDLAVSPDGRQIAFATPRTVFPLGSPSYVSPPLAAPAEESGPQEIYDVDLANDTLTRVTHGFDGTPTQSPTHVVVTSLVGSPSFSADGNTLAFSSVAPNLVYGDGNGASDVFVVKRKRFGATAVQQFISPPPGNPASEPDWLLGVSARSRRDGSVVLLVYVPGAGQLRAAAQSAVVVSPAQGARTSRRRGPPHVHARKVVATRTVAAATRASGGEGLLQVALVLAPRYRALALTRGGQWATVTLAFSAPGRPLVRAAIGVTFADPPPPHRRHAKKRKLTSSGGHHP